MDDFSSAQGQRIDLTREMDVAYWCRIFDVSIDQLRHAVHHAGHQVAEVRRYLSRQAPAGVVFEAKRDK